MDLTAGVTGFVAEGAIGFDTIGFDTVGVVPNNNEEALGAAVVAPACVLTLPPPKSVPPVKIQDSRFKIQDSRSLRTVPPVLPPMLIGGKLLVLLTGATTKEEGMAAAAGGAVISA